MSSQLTTFSCKVCKKKVEVRTREGDDIWTVFCSPEHMREWQEPLTETQIIDETSGVGMPYDRCQWCGCTLKSGYHNDDCPVRALAKES